MAVGGGVGERFRPPVARGRAAAGFGGRRAPKFFGFYLSFFRFSYGKFSEKQNFKDEGGALVAILATGLA